MVITGVFLFFLCYFFNVVLGEGECTFRDIARQNCGNLYAETRTACRVAGCRWCLGSPVTLTEQCTFRNGECTDCAPLTREQQAALADSSIGYCVNKYTPTCSLTLPPDLTLNEGDACQRISPTVYFRWGECPSSAASSLTSSATALFASAIVFMFIFL